MSTVGATFLVRKDGKILLLRRGDTAPWMPGKWDLPGGAVEIGDDDVMWAAIRELYEEAGVIAHPASLHLVATIEIPETVVFFKLTEWEGEPEYDTVEHQGMQWVTLAEAFRMDVVPGIKRALTILDSPGVRALES